MAPVIDYPARPRTRSRIRTVSADANLFSSLHRQDLEEADAVCVDLDTVHDLERAASWVAMGLSAGKQVFVVGSRETLLQADKAIKGDVTLLERTGPLTNRWGEDLADAISQEYEAMYEPFQKVSLGFIPGSEETALNIATDGTTNPPSVIDPQYFKPVLSAEQRKQLVSFLRRPEQDEEDEEEGASPAGGSSFSAR